MEELWEEGYQRLLENAGGLRKHVIEKELEEEKKTPQVEIIFPMVLEEEDVVDFLNGEVGDVPKSLLKLIPTTYRATFDAKKTAEKAVGLNERRLEGTTKKSGPPLWIHAQMYGTPSTLSLKSWRQRSARPLKWGTPPKRKSRIPSSDVGCGG